MYDVIIIGAGASGLMAAIEAAKRGRRTLIIDHAKRVGRKLLVSGGGKCNVTNTHISASDYFGADNSFCRYALKQFTTDSILRLLYQAGIETEERDHGRIFCKKGADEIVSYLLHASESGGVHFSLNTEVPEVSHTTHFRVKCESGALYESQRLLVATGGLAWPQIGATNFGYRIARQFGHKVTPLKPALTGFILPQDSPLLNQQGISLDVQIQIKGKSAVIEEPLLFTHKGMSGPSVLQVSCFWEKGDTVTINFLPSEDVISQMHEPGNGKLFVKNLFMHYIPERLVRAIIPDHLSGRKVAELGKKDRNAIAGYIHSFPVCPDSVEGFSKAEATLGGVCTGEINPESMESLLLEGLFFSGEVIDVTGRLGGYNIHWAFASGHIAGQHL
ncbi:MAG: NAD(P)/FAD-dependent oxidoreductase [Tannerella sp.]|jgi:predicted Rossmann fold flavoprotein|nr:NAD(P)/FAD-dependent oxidoreductase [Tannerella sp.]